MSTPIISAAEQIAKPIRRPHLLILAAATFLALQPVSMSPQAIAQDQGHPWDAYVGEGSPGFEDPAALVDAFAAGLAAGDMEATVGILGLAPEAIDSNDFDAQFARVRDAVAERVILDDAGEDRVILLLGRDLWPFPFPVVREDATWSFDTEAGLDEIVNRRIGENEIQAIATSREYVTAQEVYRETDWDEDGVLEFAQQLISTPETFDGLYWPSGEGVPASPAGASIEEGALPDQPGDGYFGYRFRILTGQGDNIAGGAYDYVINDNMIAGFGLIAWPVSYEETGVNTFVVNQYGTVYEKDLGEDTDALAAAIALFDPDDSWSIVTEVTH